MSREKIHVGLLLCDDIDAEDRAQFGTYAEMFGNALSAVDDNITLVPIECYRGEFPDSPNAHDAYLISGSRHGVYDAHEWIGKLQEFVRECYARQKKTVGICFGHQLIAQALGGEARKADAGWGIGIHTTRITEPQMWMGGMRGMGGHDGHDERGADGKQYNLIVIHQDQVITAPPDSRVIAENDFCPVSMFITADTMLGIQGHPEFGKDFCAHKIETRRDDIGEATYHQSRESLAQMSLDSVRVLQWIAAFLRS